MTAFVANTNFLELTGLKNAATGDYIDDATVTVTVVDSADDEVSGMSWPATMAYVSGSNGNYRVTLVHGLSFTDGERYTAKITAVDGSSQGYWEFEFAPLTRTQ